MFDHVFAYYKNSLACRTMYLRSIPSSAVAFICLLLQATVPVCSQQSKLVAMNARSLTNCLQNQSGHGNDKTQQDIDNLREFYQNMRHQKEIELEEIRRIQELEEAYDPDKGETPQIRILLARQLDIKERLTHSEADIEKRSAQNLAFAGSRGFLGLLSQVQALLGQVADEEDKNNIARLRAEAAVVDRELRRARADLSKQAAPLKSAHSALDQKDWTEAEHQFKSLIEMDNDNPDYWRGLALALEHQKSRDNETIKTYRTAIIKKPNESGAHHDLGRFLLRRGKPKDAEAEIREAIRLAPGQPIYRAALAEVYADQADYMKALTAIDDALQLDPDNVQVASERTNMGLEAEQYYGEELKKQPTHAVLYALLGKALLAQSKYPEAENALRTAVKMDAAQAEYKADLSTALSAEDKLDEASVVLLELVQKDSRQVNYLNRLALLQRKQKKYREAIQTHLRVLEFTHEPGYIRDLTETCTIAVPALEELVSQHQNDAAMQHSLATAYYFTNRYSEALGPMKKASELVPDKIDYRLDYGTLLLQKSSKSSLDDALKVLKAVLAQAPTRHDCHAALGRAYFKKRDFGAAEKEFREATKLNPNEADYPNMAGVCLFEHNEFKKADPEFQNALQLKPGSPVMLHNLGVNQHMLAKREGNKSRRDELYIEAQKNLRMAIRLNPEDGEYHGRLASCLYDFDWHEEARAEALLALRLGYEPRWLQELTLRLDREQRNGKR